MPNEAYPIIVNQNPVPPKQKSKVSFVKLFFVLTLVLILSGGSWYLIQNKPWQKFTAKEDPTIGTSLLGQHKAVWSAFFEYDVKQKKAWVVTRPEISTGDLLIETIREKPEVGDRQWAFEVVVENSNSEIVYRSWRIMSIFKKEQDPNIWEFGLTIPFYQGGILRILNLDQNQIFAEKI